MSSIAAVRSEEHSGDLLARLHGVCAHRGLPDLAARLADLGDLVAADMADVGAMIATLDRGDSLVRRSAWHLLDLGGKRLRGMCVALAARSGTGFGQAAREMALAVELVHAATLLHDDVVDIGERRRGAPAARMVYGNAAAIFAGDWLLVEALTRVGRVGMGDALERLLSVVGEMIAAESVQLERRGRLDTRTSTYFRIVEGKTAALFRWALYAGGLTGGLGASECVALERYGEHLGVAFQLVDDLIDYAGDARALGKLPFADLREGKMTYPLLVALERDPTLALVLDPIARGEADASSTSASCARVMRALAETRALETCRALARDRVDRAIAELAPLPAGRARDALITVAEATVVRES